MLAGTIVLWVASSVAVQSLFQRVHFEQPAFITLFNSACSSTLLLPRLIQGLREKGHRRGGAEVARTLGMPTASVVRLSATVGLLWLLAQWLFNLSLLHTSVATNTVLSSTSSIFTFFLSVLICRDPFRWLAFCAAMFSFLGCTMVAMQSPRSISKTAVNNSLFGDALALLSAAMSALVSVMLRKQCPGGLDTSVFMGTNGVFAVVLSPVLLYALHHAGLESFRAPTSETLFFLAVNAMMGSTLANYLYTSSLLLLSPLVANVCLALSIPISAFADGILLRQHRFSTGWMVGAGVMTAGAVFAAMDLEHVEREMLETAEAAELESLLENTSMMTLDDDCEKCKGVGSSSPRDGEAGAIPLKTVSHSNGSSSSSGCAFVGSRPIEWDDEL